MPRPPNERGPAGQGGALDTLASSGAKTEGEDSGDALVSQASRPIVIVALQGDGGRWAVIEMDGGRDLAEQRDHLWGHLPAKHNAERAGEIAHDEAERRGLPWIVWPRRGRPFTPMTCCLLPRRAADDF